MIQSRMNVISSWPGGKSGIVNLGNTCYLNTALQILSSSEDFRDFFLSDEYKENINRKKVELKLSKEIARLFKGMWEEDCIVQPVTFYQTFSSFDDQYMGFRQHDTAEALSAILDILHIGLSYEVEIKPDGVPDNPLDQMMIESIRIWSKSFKNEYSTILEMFYGQYISTVTCTVCDNISHTYDPFNQITLPIEKCKTLLDCFDKFVDPEDLDDELVCDKCKVKRKVTKKLRLWKTPKYLLISLKRFKNVIQKINSFIEFPIVELNISDYCDGYDKDDSSYELISIGNHIGGCGGGHYYAYSKHETSVFLNDQSINKLCQNLTVSSECDNIEINDHIRTLVYINPNILSGNFSAVMYGTTDDDKPNWNEDIQMYNLSSSDIPDPMKYIIFDNINNERLVFANTISNWFEFNDQDVSKVNDDLSRMITKEAYVLLYKKV